MIARLVKTWHLGGKVKIELYTNSEVESLEMSQNATYHYL